MGSDEHRGQKPAGAFVELSGRCSAICNENQGGSSNNEMTTVLGITDEHLIRRMLGGDEDAFTLLYRRRHPAIYRFALHMSGNAAVAEDVTQEVFMTLIRDAKKFDPLRGTVSAFLFGVARNHLRKRWEQDRRLVGLIGDSDEIGADESAESPQAAFDSLMTDSGANRPGNRFYHGLNAVPTSRDQFTTFETVGRVRQAIATLPKNYREVIVLCELEEMSYEEVAAALGCPLGTVRSRLHRARAVLLEKLRDAQPVRRVSAVAK